MGPEGIILVNPPITTLQQSLTHSAVIDLDMVIFALFNSFLSQVGTAPHKISGMDLNLSRCALILISVTTLSQTFFLPHVWVGGYQ